MTRPGQNTVDNIVKSKFENYEVPFSPNDWTTMENTLETISQPGSFFSNIFLKNFLNTFIIASLV